MTFVVVVASVGLRSCRYIRVAVDDNECGIDDWALVDAVRIIFTGVRGDEIERSIAGGFAVGHSDQRPIPLQRPRREVAGEPKQLNRNVLVGARFEIGRNTNDAPGTVLLRGIVDSDIAILREKH